MKATKHLLIVSAILLVLFIMGCIPSLHPLYTDEDRLIVPGLYGSWVTIDGKEQYDFLVCEEDTAAYSVLYTEFPQKGFISRDSSRALFEVNIVELDRKLFMDFYPDDDDSELDELNSLMSVHLMPMHTFAKMEISNDTLRIWRFDPAWLEELFGENRIRIAHEVVDDQIVLTASTEDLQGFISKYSEEPGAYLEPEKLIRRKN